jgi:hypothetical protein
MSDINHNLPPSIERKFEQRQGRIELSDEDVKALTELAERVKRDIRLGVSDVRGYAEFLGDEQLSSRLAELEANTDPILGKSLSVFPVTDTFGNRKDFSIPPTVNGLPIDDSFSVDAFNIEAGTMFCYGFGSELDPDEDPPHPGADNQYSFGFVANYQVPGEQDITILTTRDSSDLAIRDIRIELTDEFNPPQQQDSGSL